LKRILKELTEEGALQRGKKKSYAPPGGLPDVAVIEITGEDADGEPVGVPANWDRDEEAPEVLVLPGRDDAGPALGRGAKALAKIARRKEGTEARGLKRRGASAHRVLGVLRGEGRAMRVEPVDRKTRLAFMVDEREAAQAREGELVLVEPLAGRAHGAPR